MKQKIFGVTVAKLTASFGQTIYMVGLSLFFGAILGILLALVLVLCRKGGLKENRIVYGIVSTFVNIVRSVPFVILIVTIMPLTRAIMGTTIGSTAALVPADLLHQPLHGPSGGEQSARSERRHH